MKYIPSPSALMLLALGLPREAALFLLPPMVVALLVDGRKNIMVASPVKLMLLLPLVIPGFLAAHYQALEGARFIGLVLLILLYPYHEIRLHLFREAALLLIVYVVVFQVGILFEVNGFIVFRERFYPIAENRWEEATIELVYEGYRAVRAAGLFYNPNVMAGMVFFPYVIYASRLAKPFAGWWHTVIVAVVGMSLALTGSRTYLIAFILIVMLNAVKNRYFRLAIICGMVIASMEYVREFVFRDFSLSSGSMSIKGEILLSFLTTSLESWSGAAKLLRGGTYDIQFDADTGYIIAGWGLGGVIATVGMVVICCRRFPSAWKTIVVIYATSFANSLFYSLLNAPLFLLVVLAVAARKSGQENRRVIAKGQAFSAPSAAAALNLRSRNHARWGDIM